VDFCDHSSDLTHYLTGICCFVVVSNTLAVIGKELISRDSRKSRQKNGKKHGPLLRKSQKSWQNHGSLYSC